eukprot:CAMPEP_0197829816 /NCGR_PEP_ID=MMETSP1437-20131217/6365_1 /TAXON_ID=49252 ORGANISM="Eucampia antarctica, Strain CCMP1452" /NCGR_SAMPLE_ID=MMETSP1437 /ASSEMBLY_ACC=CAM_ASM_001096 /LENGTH=472 /DNA_ID=CAMNT_0043431795 /DNA_START=65 /DNA_END=1483 /DNA_ORIENTATION=-
MDRLFDSSSSNHAGVAASAIDLLSPNSDSASPRRDHHLFSLWSTGRLSSPMSGGLFDTAYRRRPTASTSFSSVLDTFDRAGYPHRPNSSFTEPVMGTGSSIVQSPAAPPQVAAPASNERYPHPRTSIRNRRVLPCNGTRTQSNTVKRRQTAVPTPTSTISRGPTVNATKRENSRANIKKRKLEDTSNDQCCICLEQPLLKDSAKVNGCDHKFCFGCIETWADRENTCPLCKTRFSQIERCTEEKKPPKNAVKKVKFRDQRTDSDQTNSIQGLLANMETGSMGAALTQLLLSGLHNSHGGFVAFTPTTFRPIQAHHAVPGLTTYTNSRPVYNSVAMNTRSQRPFMPNSGTDRTPASDLILLDDVDETIFDAETNPNRTPTSSTTDFTLPTEQGDAIVEDLMNTEEQEDGYGSFVQRVRNLSRERDRVLERFQYNNDRQSAFNVDAGDSAENALEIFDDSDQDDVVEVVSRQTG